MAEEVGLEVKGMYWKVCTGISLGQIYAVQKCFKKDDIWQAPGRKDKVISQEVLSDGKTSKTTIQVRYQTCHHPKRVNPEKNKHSFKGRVASHTSTTS